MSEEFITIVSGDGFQFIIDKEAAMGSGTIKTMLSDPDWLEAGQKVINLSEQSGEIVEKFCEYLLYKREYANTKAGKPIPEFAERIRPEIALELLMAADYLES
ncbi:uncharacterized protein L969DRAFT_84776 [Mixia osmundae IAM 14324]|uniref:Elongin-C n=1 Tax=Mixia osmundae (strain CBS 9802 / IAM 14324 / JCM 22182 / KY 12970) TaxID=764103 RepID=G7DTD4_MIXOS|nr:uncharacterized protein L969DRAFT_84776 [Mixia osmundae IAM 14324]KEI42882.1 hypothetical protein L969DRAFT_84776 [Mixia osmundae IAM 14324]GAA93781.1 hypothetical protein E5Q_00427 [Mixia osmundae IAM 14324]